MNWFQYKFQTTLPGWFWINQLHYTPNWLQKIIHSRFVRQFKHNEELPKKIRSSNSVKGPKLVYAHFLTTHPPILVDKTGALRQINQTIEEDSTSFIQQYLGAIQQFNQYITQLVNQIIQVDPDAVIVFASDHGLRIHNQANTQQNCQLAIRLSSNEKSILPENTNLINTFRIILNHIAGQKIELLDSSSF
jgi:hypothetical protein